METYRRDFTIGERETQRFYRMLTLRKWSRGILGFGAAGALAVWMYLNRVSLSAGMQAAAVLGGFLAGAALSTACVLTAAWFQVHGQLRRSGRTSYVQETEISGLGIRVTVGQDRAKLDFDRLQEVRETRGAFYLFLAPGQAWILPKAQMTDVSGECAALREIFRTVVPSRRLKLR